MGGFHRAYAGSRRRPVHPNCGQTERLSGNHIVVDALADMENAVRGGLDACESQFENLQRRFVGLCLLSSNDLVEFHFELWPRSREKIVVHVGNNREAIAALELAQ